MPPAVLQDFGRSPIEHEKRYVVDPSVGSAPSKTVTGNGAVRVGREPFAIEERPVDEPRTLKVGVIGAGISGITAGALLSAKVPGIELTIFDKNGDVGGTWLENTYPGVRCDVPANVYQSTFEPHTQWTEEFAGGAEIEEYWRRVARKHRIYERLRVKHRVERAEWDGARARWALTIRRLERDDTVHESVDFLISAIGRFNDWRMPQYPGMHEYEGHLRHSSDWDPTYDLTGKTVAVIGNGASGIQVVPELQPVVERLDHYCRNPTWIAGSLGGRDRQMEPMYFSAEQLREFEDPERYLRYRKDLEDSYWRRWGSVFRDAEENASARETFENTMARRLGGNPRLLEETIPDFSPNCRRLTPGPGYLEALTKENVSYIRTPIKRFTKTGIETEDGVHRPIDSVICSTGANVRGEPPFPIVSGEIDLSQAWRPDGLWGFPYAYLGIATPGFPNLAFIYGPNATVASGTTSVNVENQVTYIAKMLRKMSTQGIRTMAPSKAATDDFIEYSDHFFRRTVMSENCSSWANGGRPGGRIHALWPGSQGHFNFARRELRAEDWEYTLMTKSHNRFAWLGDGWTTRERDARSNLTEYLKKPEDIDLRSLWEAWWEP